MSDDKKKKRRKKLPRYPHAKDATLASAVLLANPPEMPDLNEPEGWHEHYHEDDDDSP